MFNTISSIGRWFIAFYLRISSDRINNVSQPIIAITAIIAVTYAIIQVEENKRSQRVTGAIEAVHKFSNSVKEKTMLSLALIEGESDKIPKIIKPDSFKVDRNKSYGLLADENGVISRKELNKVRFNVIKNLNEWENISILYLNNHVDCNILYENYIGTLVKDKKFFAKLKPFITTYGDEYDIEGSAWNSFTRLNEQIENYCQNTEATSIVSYLRLKVRDLIYSTEDIGSVCIQKIPKEECNKAEIKDKNRSKSQK